MYVPATTRISVRVTPAERLDLQRVATDSGMGVSGIIKGHKAERFGTTAGPSATGGAPKSRAGTFTRSNRRQHAAPRTCPA